MFLQLEYSGTSPLKAQSALFTPVSNVTLQIIVPSVGFAGYASISVFDSSNTLVTGPGGTAEQVLLLASWIIAEQPPQLWTCLNPGNPCACAPAAGGSRLTITGYGFDLSSSDYVCKFWCMNSDCSSNTFVQSTVPDLPTESGGIQTLVCTLPTWPYNARSLAGRTLITLEKGGVLLSYISQACSGVFDFLDGWSSADLSQGYATEGSTTLTVNGYGFEVGSENYTCIFSSPSNGLIQGGAASVVDSMTLACNVPTWPYPATGTEISVYKQSCARSQSVFIPCDQNNEIPLDAASATPAFNFIPAVARIIPTTVSSFTNALTVTVIGGGFDALNKQYVVQLTDGVSVLNISVPKVNVTGYSIIFDLPMWGSSPNSAINVSVFEQGKELPVSQSEKPSLLLISYWTGFNTSSLLPQGSAAGGDALIITGQGFAINATVGKSNDYFCRFRDQNGNTLISQSVSPLDSTKIICITPIWGKFFVAAKTVLSLSKGSYEFPLPHPEPEYRFITVWYDWSATQGSLNGGTQLTVSGYGFDTSSSYRCRFSFNQGEYVAVSSFSSPLSQTSIVCITPPWMYAASSTTILELLEGTMPVLQVQTAVNNFAVAFFSFSAWFKFSTSEMSLTQFQTAQFSFYPDTNPTGDVSVIFVSSNYSIATVSSPFLLTADRGIEGNIEFVSVQCLSVGQIYISVFSNGSNFGINNNNVIMVTCTAPLILSLSSVAIGRSGSQEIKIRPTIVLDDLVVVSVSSTDDSIASVLPTRLLFQPAISIYMNVESLTTTCVGIGKGQINLHVQSFGIEILMKNVSQYISVTCLPGFNFEPSVLSLQTGASGSISVSLDTPPTLKTYVYVQNDSPDIVQVTTGPEPIVFPFNSTQRQYIQVIYRSPGNATLRLKAVSPSLIQQVAMGCPSQNDEVANCCINLFQAKGCNFSGYLTGAGSYWTATMRVLSDACRVPDCSIYTGCFRVRCCTSVTASNCTAAAVRSGCEKRLLIPSLSERLDNTSDWGYAPAYLPVQSSSSQPLTLGLSCAPYIPCAWQECFPQNGNYDQIESDNILISALPGFILSTAHVSLQQGENLTLQLTPNQEPLNPVSITLTINPQIVLGQDGATIAFLSPNVLTFVGLETLNFSLIWNSPGLGDLLLNASGSPEYDRIFQSFQGAVSTSPGFKYYLDVMTTSKSLLQKIPLSNTGRTTFYIFPDCIPNEGLKVNISAGPNLYSLSPSHLFYPYNANSDPVNSAQLLTVSGDSGTYIFLSSAQSSPGLHILSSGVGVSSGSLRIEGYGGQGFTATYDVGIINWGFYCGADSKQQSGGNYSWLGQKNFTGPKNNTQISIDICLASSEPTYLTYADGSICVNGHQGTKIPKCVPKISFDIVNGKVFALSFDTANCYTTGITCQISLNNYSGQGFKGYFSTGVSNMQVSSFGSGYVCDWACFVTISPLIVSNQTCSSVAGNCSLVPAVIVYGDIGKLRSTIMIQEVARAMVVPDLINLQARQTISVSITPLTVPTGFTSFQVSSNSSRVATTNFFFTANRPIYENVKSFNVTDLGGGPDTVLLFILGLGTGNFDGFSTSVLVFIKPGFKISDSVVYLQQYPGVYHITVIPDTPPTEDTIVQIIADYYPDPSSDGSASIEPIVQVNQTFLMPKSELSPQLLVLVHNGADGSKMENRVSGSVNLFFVVSGSASNYDGVDRNDAGKIRVYVLPGFKSNIQDSHTVVLQKDSVFVLQLMLDHLPSVDTNFSIGVSNTTLVTSKGEFFAREGDQGPYDVPLYHARFSGLCYLHIRATSADGNYAHVELDKYLWLNLRPGFITSVNSIDLQQQDKYSSFMLGLDTRPMSDTVVSVRSSNPLIATASSIIKFYSSEWVSPQTSMQSVLVMWGSPGTATLSFVADNPGSTYDEVASGNITVTAYQGLHVSASAVLVQKGGTVDISISTPLKTRLDTTFSYLASPSGVVALSAPYVLPHDTNDSFILTISHLHRGSATVRILASAPGDIYDGVSYDILATAMPGFNFSSSNIQLYSCTYNAVCDTNISVWLDTQPTADVAVHITSSDPTIVAVSPNEAVFPAATGTSKQIVLNIKYVSTGLACLSFAATSVGNYDKVSCGGVTITALPDLIISQPIMNMPLGAYPHGISDFDMYKPIIYVVDGANSTFILSPSVPPDAAVLVKVINDSPNILQATSNVSFQSENLDGSLMHNAQGQVITMTYRNAGTAVLTFECFGGNYEEATGPQVLVKAVPLLSVASDRVNIPYNSVYNLTIVTTLPVSGSFSVNLRFDSTGIVPGGIGGGPGSAIAIPSHFLWPSGQNSFTVAIQHVSAGWTRLRIVATGNTSNYHHSETIVILTLLFPGWDLSSNVVHVQRWRGDTLYPAIPPLRGYGLLYVSPQAYPDAVTTVEVLNQNPNAILVQSQQYLEFPNGQNSPLMNQYPFSSDDTLPMKYYFNISHLGIVAQSIVSFNTPTSAKWPTASGCVDSDVTCPTASGYAIYYAGNYLQVISPVTVYTHAGFITTASLITIQRQGSQTFSVALDYPPDADTTITFQSSNGSIALVTSTVTFFLGETEPRNVTVININPGVTNISFLASSSGIAYGGAEAINALKIVCLKGFAISSLLVNVQAMPTNGGLGSFYIRPDDVPSASILILVNSSHADYIQVVTPTVTFRAGNASAQAVVVRNMKPGTAAVPIKLTLSLITDKNSNYFGVILPTIDVVPLGGFVFSHTEVIVQKGRTIFITVEPDVSPDEDVTVTITISNETVASCTQTVFFLAHTIEAQNISISHNAKGLTTLSVSAYSVQGNYNGSILPNGVKITALHGFTAFYIATAGSDTVPASRIGLSDRLVVQKQPTSPLSYAEFLVTTDDLVDQDITVLVLSTDSAIAAPVTEVISFQSGQRSFDPVTVKHGGTSGQAIIFFRVIDGSSSNYAGVESGNITISASPGLIISDSLINVQRKGVATLTVRPDTFLTGDVIVYMYSSDSSIATVQPYVKFSQTYQLGQENTVPVTITYQNGGTASISFFASGANYDGTVWYNGVIATCRPGFILSLDSLVLPYAGTGTFTIKPDTVPTADTIVNVVSSQPTKVSARSSQLLLPAGVVQDVPVTLQSRCSTDPGNCARSGTTIISFVAISNGGNYDGVNSSNYILVVLSPPALDLSETVIHIQQSLGFEKFTVSPTVPPNLDTVLTLAALDPAICSVTPEIILRAASSSSAVIPVDVIATFLGIGQTYIMITVSGPSNSIFADIDPLYVYVRTLGSFNLSAQSVLLQDQQNLSIAIWPNLEISSNVTVSLQVSDPLILSVEPLQLIFCPPSTLIGMSVPPRVGMQVVRSEAYQVWPRLGVGIIAQILNDNLDLVTVNWTSGIELQPNPVGLDGKFSLALYTNTIQKFSISWVSNGLATITLSAISGDVNYNGAIYVDAVTVQAQPTVLLTPPTLKIQMGETAAFVLRPSVSPSIDMEIFLTPLMAITNGSQDPFNVVTAFPNTTSFLRVFGTRKDNSKVINVSCLTTGSTFVRFRGNSGNYKLMDCTLLPISCLPGFKISKSVTQILTQDMPRDSILVSLLSVPTVQVTVVITCSSPNLILFTNRLIFEPMLSHQTAVVQLERAGAFTTGVAYLSLHAYGGNYEGAELLQGIKVPVKGPSIELSTSRLSVQPGSTSIFFVRLDTAPSAFVWINATSSDESIVMVTGSGVPFTDTIFRPFNVTYVGVGVANVTLSIYSATGSTYGSFVPPLGTSLFVQIQAQGAGFGFSETQITLIARNSGTIFFGPDTVADSTVIAQVC